MKREVPGPGQESVWDYPRPPRVEPEAHHVTVVLDGRTIAESASALRVLETSHPPNIYLPCAAVAPGVLIPNPRQTVCEWKGQAGYWDVHAGQRMVSAAAWGYRNPRPGYEALVDYVSFYPGLMDACYLDDEIVVPQPGSFYGGWITSDVVGPFKGGAGSWGW